MRNLRDQAAKNVLMKDGTARRLPVDRAEALIASGKAKHYISNTVFRALSLGLDVADPKTRDEKGHLRAKIRDARERSSKKAQKKAEKEARQEEREEALSDD